MRALSEVEAFALIADEVYGRPVQEAPQQAAAAHLQILLTAVEDMGSLFHPSCMEALFEEEGGRASAEGGNG